MEELTKEEAAVICMSLMTMGVNILKQYRSDDMIDDMKAAIAKVDAVITPIPPGLPATAVLHTAFKKVLKLL